MRKIITLLGIVLFSISIAFTTNPPVSKWMKNISEGEGEMAVGFTDENSEILVEGNVIHILWTSNENSIFQLYYRKSDDSGRTWEAKKLIFSGIYNQKTNKRLFVSGNYIHIALINQQGYGLDEVLYIRSTNGGESFEDPEVIYNPGYWHLDYIKISGDGGRVNIAVKLDCSGCGGVPTPILFHSNDNGGSFVERDIPDEYNGNEFNYWDISTAGSNIYFYFIKAIGPWYNYDYELYFVSSNDDGESFNETLISTPAQNGLHHTLLSFDTGWGYTSKIAAVGNRVAMIWTGLNAQNEISVFVGVSDDRGMSFPKVKEVASGIVNLQTGLETLTLNGDEIYACYNTNDSKVYVVKSVDGGNSFGEAYLYTQPNNEHPGGMWGPVLKSLPNGSGAILVCAGPTVGFLSPGEDDSHPAFVGNFTIDGGHVSTAVDDDGFLHIVYRAGNALIGTGGFTDFDIYYKKIDLDYEAVPGSSNYTLQLELEPLQQDDSGYERFDNMLIPFRKDFVFNEAITVEMWVKPEADDFGRILTQLAASTWNTWNPESFQIWVDGYDPSHLVCGIWTETGPYVINAPKALQKGYWTHIAVTYADNGEADNYKLYIQGQLAASTTATGALITDFANWYLGSTLNSSSTNDYSFIGEIDELRFWEKALSQEEITEQMFGQLSGTEEGLKAYYNFDFISEYGEVGDITGNGNTGYLMYWEESVESTINKIDTDFSYIESNSCFFFTPAHENYDYLIWDFGDGQSSELLNPKYIYSSPGNYSACFTGFQDVNYGITCKEIVIEGIKDFVPKTGGNLGNVTMRITGGGLSDETEIFLSKSGVDNIDASDVQFAEPDLLLVVFDLFEKETGKWNIHVINNGDETILSEPFTIIEAEGSDPWVEISTPRRTRPYRWEDVVITLGNNGDVDALLTPLHIFIPDPLGELEVNLVGFNETTMIGMEEINIDSSGVIPEYIELDTLVDEVVHGRLYALLIPSIPVDEIITTKIRVKTPESIAIKAWVSRPWLSIHISDEKSLDRVVNTTVCLSYLTAAVTINLSGIGPLAQCVSNFMTQVSKEAVNYGLRYNKKKKIDFFSTSWTWTWLIVDCGFKTAEFFGNQLPIVKIYKFITDKSKYYEWAKDFVLCFGDFLPDDIKSTTLFTFFSSDPNEIIGPSGFGENNYIQANSNVNYTITYENKPDATAPAAEVTIFDTLDITKFDINSFRITSYGFGDSTFIANAGDKSFAQDIDLGNDYDYIVRFKGDISEEGYAEFRFTTLMKDSLALPSDPLIGFLPPNQESPEGEGFVSYVIRVKDEIGHDVPVSNQAAIIFDYNPPIFTNIHEFRFDEIAPESTLSIDQTSSVDTLLNLTIEKSDDGSQIKYIKIYTSVNDSAYILTSFVPGDIDEFIYDGEYNKQYKFYSIAVDSVDNEEIWDGIPDIETIISSTHIEDQIVDGFELYPTPADDQITMAFSLKQSKNLNAGLYDLEGRQIKTLFNRSFTEGYHEVDVPLDMLPGVYVIRLEHNGISEARKLVVVRE